MPIECRFNTKDMSRHRFHELDLVVMRHAFDIQNELGRLCHETVYQTELIRRCTASGLTLISEGEIVVSLDSLRKSYFIDALIASGAVYELKAVCDLSGHHESQLLNYLFLSNLAHGKLINFSSSSVQYRFVTTTIDAEQRFSFSVVESGWDAGLSSSSILRGIVPRLLEEWGCYLDVSLYREAIIHLLDFETGFHVSSIIRHERTYRKQLQCLLEHTSLRQMQWVNFNRKNVEFITLKK
jgi:GxxExxY protein